MATISAVAVPPRWELAAEAIAVKIRWFGLIVGYALVNIEDRGASARLLLNAILTVGALYTLFDTYFSMRGRVFLGRYPLSISLMEALFIGQLCYYHGGLESPFRYYYFLSLICCAIRRCTARVSRCCSWPLRPTSVHPFSPSSLISSFSPG
jgi:hypothetical protein